MRKNIPKYYTYSIFMALSFSFVPFFALFMINRGLTFSDIGITLGYYYSLFLVLELPGGVIADKLGRKTTLALAGIFKVCGVLMTLASFTLPGFLFAETFFALSRSLSSGADSAFLYETLAFNKDESAYKKYEGKATAYRGIALMFGGIIGGTLAIWNVEYVYIFAASMAALATFTTLSFKETGKVHKGKARSFKANIAHLKESVKEVLHNKKMMWIIGYSSLIFITLRASTVVLQQPLLISLGMPDYYFGYFDAIISISAALIAWYAHAIEEKIGVRGITLFMPLLAIIIFISVAITTLAIPLLALAIFALIFINWGLHEPVFRDYLNIEVKDSEKRATILSVDSMVSRVIFAVVSLSLGFILDLSNGIQLSFIFLAIFTTVGMIILGFLRRTWKIT